MIFIIPSAPFAVICKRYPNKQDIIFITKATPSSNGTFIMHVYSTSDIKNGLPNYSSAIYVSLYNIYHITTRLGVFYIEKIVA